MSEAGGPLVFGLIAPDEADLPLALDGARRVATDDPAAQVVVVLGDVEVIRAAVAHVGPPIIAFLDTLDHRTAARALDAGAAGVLGFDAAPAQLFAAVRAVAHGLLVRPQRSRVAEADAALTVRQQEILGLVVLGLSNSDIASRLFLTESTVKSHLSAAFRKLGVRSRREAVEELLAPDSQHVFGLVGSAPSGDYRTPTVTPREARRRSPPPGA